MSDAGPPDSYRTITTPSEYEPDKTKGSRHIATIVPVQNLAQVTTAIETVRLRMPDANHHAWAYRLGRGRDEFRYSDDGEPSGSAGRPILQQIDGHDVTDVLVVVSRYFGGTKLGVGGLVRAYGGAAAAALDHADIRTVVPQATVRIAHAYEDSGAVAAVLNAFDLTPRQSQYAANVELELQVPDAQADEFTSALRDATAGRATIDVDRSDRADGSRS